MERQQLEACLKDLYPGAYLFYTAANEDYRSTVLLEMTAACEAATDEAAHDVLKNEWINSRDAAVKIRRYLGIPREPFDHSFECLSKKVNDWATRKGWNEGIPPHGDRAGLNHDITQLALMMTELSEAIEGLRHGDIKSDHIPEFLNVEEELADCIIRIAHFAAQRKLRVGQALVAKMDFNEGRPYRHGKLV